MIAKVPAPALDSAVLANLPFDPVPHVRNKWQLLRGYTVFGRWRHDGGIKQFVLGAHPPNTTHLSQVLDGFGFSMSRGVASTPESRTVD